MKLDVVKSASGEWSYDSGRGHLMTASCHHQHKGACGGCYARAVEVLSAISEADGNADARALVNHLKTEKRRLAQKK